MIGILVAPLLWAQTPSTAGQAPPPSAPAASIVGRWTLNVGQSDRGADMIQPSDTAGAKPRQNSPLGGGGFGNGGFGGFGHHGERPGRAANSLPLTDQERVRMRQTLQLALDAPSMLTITQSDSTVELTGDTAAALVVRTDGIRQVMHVRGAADVELRGSWQGHDFSVQRKVAGGGTVTEDYFHAPDGAQLYVVVGFDGAGGRSVMFRRIYDPSPE
ncbi:MAG TPA: hypothetical protein VN848_10280 [Gemmatimonadales bacterium]|nr:hypothetical protein [Gemmatimonadales bacterium]